MANIKITGLTSLPSIDRAADVLEIVDVSADASYKVTPNSLLGLSSAPLGTADSQSPTNKTFDNSNIFTVRDDRLTLQDNSDTTKQAQFQLSGISTGTTRTFTFPDASTTLAGLTATQTLTNKTLTSPTINGGTIANAAIQSDSVAEYTVGNGVAVDGLNIKDGALNTNNSVVTANITDGAVTPAKLLSGTGSGWTWGSWTPTWTNLTVGNGTLNYAKYTQVGKTVFYRIKLTFGSTSAVSGVVGFSPPVNLNSDYNADAPLFSGLLNDATGSIWFPFVTWGAANRIDIHYLNGSSNLAALSSTTPFTWATNDIIMVSGAYQAA